MNRFKFFSIVFFVAACTVFGIYHFKKNEVDDHVAPKIVMDEEKITISVTDGEEKMLEGVTASDDRDGDVSSTLLVESMSSFIEPGRRTVTIAAFDKSSNVAKVTREIVYSDYEAPKFELDGPFKFPLNYDNMLSHVTVSDVLDGDITNSVKISSEYLLDNTQVGDYHMILSVSNSAGDTVELPVTVQIYDQAVENMAPKFTLTEYITTVPIGSAFNPWVYMNKIKLNGAEYTMGPNGVLLGNDDEIISQSDVIIDSSAVDTSKEGVYQVAYSIADKVGRVGVVRLVVVVK